jgi:hypothetical protein
MIRPEPLEPNRWSDLANIIVMLIEDKGVGYIVYDLGGETIVAFGSNGDLEIQFDDEGNILLFHTRKSRGGVDFLGCSDIRPEDPDCIPLIEKWIEIIYGNQSG